MVLACDCWHSIGERCANCGRLCHGFEMRPTGAATMQTTSRPIFAAILGLSVLSAMGQGALADDATDWANQLAQAQKERDDWQRQQEQAQRDRDDWYKQREQADRDRAQAEQDAAARQKVWDDW